MLIPKNYSNCGGECLCDSCAFGLPVHYDKKTGDMDYYCRKNSEEVIEVGICKDYEEARFYENLKK